MRQLRGLFSAATACRSTRFIAGLMAVAVMMLGTGTALRAQASLEFKVGDVAVAIPGGKVQIYNASGTLVDTLTVGSKEVGGCAFDSTYRLRCVDFGDATAVKFALQYPFGVTQTLTGLPANPQSILYSGAANDFIVGFAGDPATVNEYDYGGGKLESCTVTAVDSSNAFWTDISSDGKTIYYTSGVGNGHKASVRTLDLSPSSACATSTVFSAGSKTVSAGQGFFGLRLLSGTPYENSDLNGDFLLANGDGVVLVDSAGEELHSYTGNLGESSNDWRSVALSPDSQSFWSENLATGHVYEFAVAPGAANPVEGQFDLTSVDDAGGIAVEGGYSAALPAVQTATLTLNPNSDSVGTGSACFYDTDTGGTDNDADGTCTPATPPPTNANQVTVTLDGLTGPDTVTVRFTEIDNSTESSVGTSDTGFPCLVESYEGGMCTVWEIESSGASFTHNNLLFSSPQTPSASDNPVLLLNEATDFTSLQGGDIFIQGGSDGGFSVFSQNSLPAGTDVSSGWENPITDTADNSFNYGSNIKFQFYLTDSSGVVATSSFGCSTSSTNSCPELRLSLLQPGEAPQLITSDTAGNEGSSGTATLVFRPISSTEWGVNLNTSTVPAGCYVATGVDPQDRFVPFSYSTTTKPSTTILAIGESTDTCTQEATDMGLLGP